MVNCEVQVLGLGTLSGKWPWRLPGEVSRGICDMSPGQVGGKLSSKGGRRRVVPHVEGECRQKCEAGMSPACPRDGEEPGLGGGQVRKPEKSVRKRLVWEQPMAGACVRHVCRTLCLEFFCRGREFGSACIFSLVFSALF